MRFIRDYESLRDRVVDFVFVTVKTYDLPAVKADMDALGVRPRVAEGANGIVAPLFDVSVRVVIPQSYDFVETPGLGCGVDIHVKNEEKPWVMPDTPEAKEVEALLERCKRDTARGGRMRLMYSLLRKFFINCDQPARHRRRLQLQRPSREPSPTHGDFIRRDDGRARRGARETGTCGAPGGCPRDVVFSGLATYGEHFPSTKLDFDAGRALEIDSPNGYVCQVARRDGSAEPGER